MIYILASVLVLFFLASAIRILSEYERGVIFRLGRVIKAKGPGLIILIPVIDKVVRVSLRLVAMDVPPQDEKGGTLFLKQLKDQEIILMWSVPKYSYSFSAFSPAMYFL